MIYVNNLHDLIMNRHKHNNAGELIVLGGWIGPIPVENVSKLNIESKIIYGCKKRANLTTGHHNLYQKISGTTNTEVFYKDTYNHSKIYCWHDKGSVKEVIAGSANFSTHGLKRDGAETLFDVDSADYNSVYTELMNALNDSQSCLQYNLQTTLPKKTRGGVKKGSKVFKAASFKTYPTYHDSVLSFNPPSARISFRDSRGNFSQINTGKYKANTARNDCVIGIKVDILDAIPQLFPNNGFNPSAGKGHGRAGKKKQPDTEFLFDDGTIMEMSFEGVGSHRGDGRLYKNLRSYGSNEILGSYLRKRMGVPLGRELTDSDFKNYGSDSIDITLVGSQSSPTYLADFSPNRDFNLNEELIEKDEY